MWTLHLLFALRLCTAEITTECWRPSDGPEPSVRIALTYATRDACEAARARYRDAYFTEEPVRVEGVPANFELDMSPWSDRACAIEAVS